MPELTVNPYTVPAGPELDQLVHSLVMRQDGANCPPYSTNHEAAHRVLIRLKSLGRDRVTIGNTRIRERRWFARYETNPSDGTEVMADTLSLAICRLALIKISKR